jgi:hypothetical protein
VGSNSNEQGNATGVYRSSALPDRPLTGRAVQAATWGNWIPTLFEPRQFVTLTSREEISAASLCRRYGFIVQQVNRNLYGNNWRRKGLGLSHVYGIEPQRRGVLHIHAVWDAEFVPYELIHSIANKYVGWCWIEPVRGNSSVGYYVTKYAVKSGSVFVYLSRHKEALGNAGLSLT